MFHLPNPTRQTFRPSVECLEDRTVPAGTLNSTLVKGTLTITAVNSANAAFNHQNITIRGDGLGNFTVLANDDEIIKGKAGNEQLLNGVNHIKLVLGAGNDTVTVENANLLGTLTVNGGTGNNSVILNGAGNTFGNVRIVNGMGNDLFQSDAQLTVTGNLTISNGQGDTKLLLNAAADIDGSLAVTNTGGIDIFTAEAALDVARHLTLKNGAGTARLTLNGATQVGGNFSLVNGYGGDTTEVNGALTVGGNLSLNYGTSAAFGNAPDGEGGIAIVPLTGSSTKFNAAATIGGNLTIRGKGGIDRVVLQGITVNGTSLLDLGAQDDVVIITDSTFKGRTTINTGSGNDTIRLENDDNGINTVFQNAVSVNAGAGNDLLVIGQDGGDSVTFTSAKAPVTLNGGPGTDTLRRENVFAVALKLLNWEIDS